MAPGASGAPPSAVPTLPLRADVLLSNALFEELDDGISAEFLRQNTGHDDLEEVDFAELQVDAVSGSQRVECIGELLPNLQQLRLNESSICTIRDLGTSLARLRVLWLCRTSLQDLGGVTAMPVLEELYVSFNDIRELSPLCTHEALQVLDLEGNLVEDLEEVRALQAVGSLRELNLSMNPLWRQANIARADVLASLPQLEVLDDIPCAAAEGAPSGEIPWGSDPAAAIADVWASGGGAGPEPLLDVEELLADGPLSQGGPLGGLEDSQALRRLRERAGPALGQHGNGGSAWVAARAELASRGAAGPGSPVASGPSGLDGRFGRGTAQDKLASLAEGPPCSSDAGFAVAAMQAERARLRAAAAQGTSQAQLSQAEPSEQDLIVERLKRSARPAPGTWRLHSLSARPAEGGRRPTTGFFPGRRPLTAWSSGRPTTASSGTGATSSRSTVLSGIHADSDAAASDLTTGDDGAPLAGNPLSAVRRRRRTAAAQGEDELSIWNLLRRTEAEAGAFDSGPPQMLPEGREPGRITTPDVRISPARLLTSGGGRTGTSRLLTSGGRRSSGTRTPAAHAASPAVDAGDIPAPSMAAGSVEVLYID